MEQRTYNRYTEEAEVGSPKPPLNPHKEDVEARGGRERKTHTNRGIASTWERKRQVQNPTKKNRRKKDDNGRGKL